MKTVIVATYAALLYVAYQCLDNFVDVLSPRIPLSRAAQKRAVYENRKDFKYGSPILCKPNQVYVISEQISSRFILARSPPAEALMAPISAGRGAAWCGVKIWPSITK